MTEAEVMQVAAAERLLTLIALWGMCPLREPWPGRQGVRRARRYRTAYYRLIGRRT